MNESEKAVLRYTDGNLLKGYIKDFSPNQSTVTVEEVETKKIHNVSLDELKAIFFVHTFEGNRKYKEKKTYGISKPRGNKVYIQFKDKEYMVGFLEGDVPWKRGFYLSKHDTGMKGFFLLPVDRDANNIKIFVVTSAVTDVTVVPHI